MKRQSVKKASAAVTALITAMTSTCAYSAMICAKAAGNTAFPYTMFAGSDAAGALTVNAKHLCMNGSVAANGTIVTGRKANINGTKKEHAAMDMPFVSEKIGSRYFSNARAAEALSLSDHNINLNTTYDVAGEACFKGNINMNASVRADADISISGNVSNFNNAVLYSEFGDISIDCNNVSMTGLIYAPLGKVTITANNINLNNTVIIADTITLNANNVNANYGRSYADTVGTDSETKASYIAKFNSYMMDVEADNILKMISQYYNVKPLDAGEFANISMTAPLAPGFMVTLDFEVQQYEVEGYGNLSVMKTDGMQQMSTIVLTPFNKDLPLISTDYMFNGEGRVSYIEFYGLGINGDENIPAFEALRPLQTKYAQYADQPPTPGWFDEVRTMGLFKATTYKDDAAISQMLYDSFRITLDASKTSPDLSEAQRIARYYKTQDYVDHLISNPGVSTAIFNMCLGAERTSQFFNNVFFGTGLWKPEQTLDYSKQVLRDLPGVSNARQLGGYINKEGKAIKQNVLLRTANLSHIQDRGIQALQNKYKVSDIMDFRYDRELNPNTIDKEIPGAVHHNLPMSPSKAYAESVFSQNADLYARMLELQRNAGKPGGSLALAIFQSEVGVINAERSIAYFESDEAAEYYRQAFEIFLNKPEDAAVLFHCAGGKDRTGIVSALLLSALDFDRDVIMQDYLMSNIANADKIAETTAAAEAYTDDPELRYNIIYSAAVYPEIMERNLDDFTAQYGSVKGFLREKVGLTDADFQTLKALYLEG
ncbi:MAG: tyrosine-protein phosphatase [Oscillospiraceae bacterium]|nr:tyrosine-protein phosphatase [Oscillospiraceae bacterium]